MTEKSENTLLRDVKKGKVSAERDDREHLKFDPTELRRVYGELKSTGDEVSQLTEIGNDKAMTGNDKEREIAELAASSGRCAMVFLSNQKSDLPNFHLSDTLHKSSFGWHYEAYRSVCLPPFHLRRGLL